MHDFFFFQDIQAPLGRFSTSTSSFQNHFCESLATRYGENGTAAIDTVPTAGLAQDDITLFDVWHPLARTCGNTLVACPAPSYENMPAHCGHIARSHLMIPENDFETIISG